MGVTHTVTVFYDKQSNTIQLWSYNYDTLWQHVYWQQMYGTVIQKTFSSIEFQHMKRNITEI